MVKVIDSKSIGATRVSSNLTAVDFFVNFCETKLEADETIDRVSNEI